MRFEKVSFTAFYNDAKKAFYQIADEKINAAYDAIRKPVRKTKYSAGYDFVSPFKIVLTPGQMIKIPSGIKCYFSEDDAGTWHLKLYDRSSIGLKYDVQLPNGTGVIDGDYYNNPSNEGDIVLALKNNGHENLIINRGDRICQGIFEIYGITTDDEAKGERTGGIGSTGTR